MKTMSAVLAALTVAHCCQVQASEQELQITPRLGFGKIEPDPAVLTLDGSVADDDGEADTVDAGVGFAYLTPFGLVLEAGLQVQTNIPLGGFFDDLSFFERYAAVGFQLDFGNGFRLTPKVGRTRWELHSDEGFFLSRRTGRVEDIDGYEDFYEVSFTKTISESVSMGVRYKQANYNFGEVDSVMFVTTFGIR